MKIRLVAIAIGLWLAGAVRLTAQTKRPAPKIAYYVNPLSIEDTRSIADPAAIRFKGKYYLFLSGGMAWASDDLVHWTHHPVPFPAAVGFPRRTSSNTRTIST